MNPTTDVCLRYLDGDLTPSESADFDRLVAESSEVAGELARCLIDEHYFAKTQATDNTAHIDASDASALNQAVRHLERHEESDQVLRELLRMEREAIALPRVVEDSSADESISPERSHALTWGEVSGATVYLLAQAARSTPARWLAAAVVLLVATLLIAFNFGGNQTNDGTPAGPAFTQGLDDSTTAQLTAAVASLTAVNAPQWESDSDADMPVVGEELVAGQSLTLLQGTAQITTARGAIANLHAPCTIELLEGGNGLRLIHGRLVGICETESSKGFLVRTAQMDVTDLGTRFGVDATRADATEVHVFQGEVSVALPVSADTGAGRVLSAGQAIAAQAGRDDFLVVEQDAPRFASIQRIDLQEPPASSGLAGVRSIAGDLEIASNKAFMGKDTQQLPAADHAFVFHDFIGRLQLDVTANITDSGIYDEPLKGEGLTIPAGTDLRSYIICKTVNPSGADAVVRGSVTFDSEVVGIITDKATNDAFAAAIRPTSPVFTPGAGGHRWIDLFAFEESITLSEDKRTVTFQMKVKESTDMIRVLVRVKETDR